MKHKRWTDNEHNILYEVYANWPCNRRTQRRSAGWAQRASQLLADRTVEACSSKTTYVQRRLCNAIKAQPPVQMEINAPSMEVPCAGTIIEFGTKEDARQLNDRVDNLSMFLVAMVKTLDSNCASIAKMFGEVAKDIKRGTPWMKKGAPNT